MQELCKIFFDDIEDMNLYIDDVTGKCAVAIEFKSRIGAASFEALMEWLKEIEAGTVESLTYH